jgi:diaminopimelate epimerase
MTRIPFTKMHGTGNDFVLVELPHLGEVPAPEFSIASSERRFGAGSDGLLVVEPSQSADTRMRMYNPDGSEAMCGNGIRCFGKYVYEKGLVVKETMTVETIAGIKTLELEIADGIVDSIRVDMGEPIFDRAQIPVSETEGEVPVIDQEISVLDTVFKGTIVSMGNPHCVIFVDELVKEDVIRFGCEIEVHPFFPERVNVEFVKVLDRGRLEMNVFERGAGFTLSCGTGTCAAAVAAHLKGLTDDAVSITIPGGELHVEYADGGRVFMSGPAAYVYEGEFLWDR